MAEHPLKVFEKIDTELWHLIQNSNAFTFSDGALKKKYKLLIAMALDAAHGASDGVKSLATQAMNAGATRDEIVEAMRVAQHVCGVGSVYVAARAFQELF